MGGMLGRSNAAPSTSRGLWLIQKFSHHSSRHPSHRPSHQSQWTPDRLRPNLPTSRPSCHRPDHRTIRRLRNCSGPSRRCCCRRTARALRPRCRCSSCGTPHSRCTKGATGHTAGTAPPTAGSTPSRHPPGPRSPTPLCRRPCRSPEVFSSPYGVPAKAACVSPVPGGAAGGDDAGD
jgi:hypothetical protein